MKFLIGLYFANNSLGGLYAKKESDFVFFLSTVPSSSVFREFHFLLVMREARTTYMLIGGAIKTNEKAKTSMFSY